MLRLLPAAIIAALIISNQTSAQSFIAQAVTELGQPGWGTVRKVAWSPDGERLAVSTSAGVWVYYSAHFEAIPQQVAENYGVFSPDWTLLAVTSDDNSLRLLDAESGSEQTILEGNHYPIATITFSPDGTLISITFEDRNGDEGIWLWDVITGSRIRVLDAEDFINVVSFSPDGRLIAAASPVSGKVYLWHVESGMLIASVIHQAGSANELIFGEDSAGNMTLALALEGSMSGDYGIQIYVVSDFFGPKPVGLDCNTTTEEMTCPHHRILSAGEDVHSMAISPDRGLVAAGTSSSGVQVFDFVTGAEQASLTNDNRVITMAFSPHDTLLAWGSADGIVRIWDLCVGVS